MWMKPSTSSNCDLFLHPFGELVNEGMLDYLVNNRPQKANGRLPKVALSETTDKLKNLLEAVKSFSNGEGDVAELEKNILADIKAVLSLPLITEKYPLPRSREVQDAGNHAF